MFIIFSMISQELDRGGMEEDKYKITKKIK